MIALASNRHRRFAEPAEGGPWIFVELNLDRGNVCGGYVNLSPRTSAPGHWLTDELLLETTRADMPRGYRGRVLATLRNVAALGRSA